MGLLNALIDSSDRFEDNLLPIGYTDRAISWFVDIDASGKSSAVVQKQSPKRTIKAPATPSDRTSCKISPTLLVDKVSYALGVADAGKKGDFNDIAKNEHKEFVELVRSAAAKIPALTPIADWLEDQRNVQAVAKQIKAKAKPNELVAFEVNSEPRATDDPAVQQFWSDHMSIRLGEHEQICVVCGTPKPIARIVPFKLNVMNYSVQLSSFNSDAFCSAGSTTKSGNNAALCYTCAGTGTQVLQHLLKLDKDEKGKPASSGRHAVVLAYDDSPNKTQPLRNQIAVFWTKRPLVLQVSGDKHESDELPRLTLEEVEELPDEGPPAYANQVRQMLEAPWKGGSDEAALAPNRFYLAVLSPNKSRLVVREWLEQDVEPLRDHLKRYIDALQIIHPDGRGIWFPPLPAILYALQSPISAQHAHKEKPRLPQVEPDLMRKLIRSMFTGVNAPGALLARAVRCFRVPEPPTDHKRERERQMLRRMALAAAMKLVLTHDKNEQEQRAMEERHTEHDGSTDYKKQSPYLCGCLLAVLEAIQARPGRKVNTTLVDRFYGSASTAPATVFATLINMATKAHLPKLRREGKEFFRTRSSGEKAVNINDLMTECCDAINKAGGFPPPLAPEQQAQFALGFYHERAELNPRRPSRC